MAEFVGHSQEEAKHGILNLEDRRFGLCLQKEDPPSLELHGHR